MMKMNTKKLGILPLLAVLVIVVVLISGWTKKQSTSGSNSLDITGAWHGTYKSARGNGEWSWVIKKFGNEYIGILTTTEPYNGENVPVSVTLEGNKITVGWVAAGVVFEGTISGDKMSGKWKFQNGMDGGNWQGVRGKCAITPKGTLVAGQTAQNLSGEVNSLPIYPGSQESGQYNMWATITGFSSQFSEFHTYVVKDASPIDVINWYKSQFSGYTIDQGTTNAQGATFATLSVKKRNIGIGIMAFEQEGKTVYFVGKAIMPEEEGASLPNRDMASGEEPLQRYPGSVMLVYTKQGNFPIDYEITYGTNDAYDKVADWFKRTLQSQRWNVTYQSGSSDSVELVFKKDDDEVTIWVGAPAAGDRSYTEITVSYTKRNLPDHDLVEGKDPLPRYPGAVMIDYQELSSPITYQGRALTEIKAEYLAPGTFSKVKKWYRNQLNQIFSSVFEDKYSIEAGQIKGTMVTVRVEFTKYSKFTDVRIDYSSSEK